MFRRLSILLVAAFLTIGPNYFQNIHVTETNRALARIASPKLAPNSPLKKLPSRAPLHDPASCPICIALHAPVAHHFAPSPPLQPLAEAGLVSPSRQASLNCLLISPDHCRGPPAA